MSCREKKSSTGEGFCTMKMALRASISLLCLSRKSVMARERGREREREGERELARETTKKEK